MRLQKYGIDWPKVQQAVGTKDLTQTKNYYQNSKTRLKLDMLPLAPGAKLPKSSPRSKPSSSPPCWRLFGLRASGCSAMGNCSHWCSSGKAGQSPPQHFGWNCSGY